MLRQFQKMQPSTPQNSKIKQKAKTKNGAVTSIKENLYRIGRSLSPLRSTQSHWSLQLFKITFLETEQAYINDPSNRGRVTLNTKIQNVIKIFICSLLAQTKQVSKSDYFSITYHNMFCDEALI